MQSGPLEKDTCRDYVMPLLKQAGWSTDQIVEQNRMASVPLQGVWRFAWIAGETMVAMMEGSYALASYGWLVVAEGMWRDLEGHRIGSRPRGFYAKSKKTKPNRFGHSWRGRKSL